MLILTGPQGSGNHLWSKIFSLHPAVYGWKTLLDNYWESHRHSEPFRTQWRNHELLKEFDWQQSDYYFTSISLPIGYRFTEDNDRVQWTADIMGFTRTVLEQGVEVEIAVIGRDQNILQHQQNRVREETTLSIFLSQLPTLQNPTFLSYELLYLYKQEYLKSLKLNIPIAWDDLRLGEILADDANEKYIHSIEYNELDNGNKLGVTFTKKP